MIDNGSYQVHGDRLLQAWSALQEADEQDASGLSQEVQASFGEFSEMVNAMMDKGVLGEVMDNLGERMVSGEIEVPPDMLMDIIDSLSVCVGSNTHIYQMIAVPLSGQAGDVLEMARGMDWSAALASLGVVEDECELVGVAQDTEMSLLMLDVVAVGALTRGLSASQVHGVFLEDDARGQFHGVALVRCRSHYSNLDTLSEVLVDDEQDGIEEWTSMLSFGGKVHAQGPRLPREGVAGAAAARVVATLEMLRATEPDQARPGVAAVMFGLDAQANIDPDDMCWVGAIYQDGTCTSIKAFPAALAPLVAVVCDIMRARMGIDASPVELSDMFNTLAGLEKQLSAANDRGLRLH